MIALFKLLRLCLAALLAASFFVSAAYAQKWVQLAPFPEPSEELYGMASGGKLYVFGGLGPAWTPKGLVYEYDPGGDTWSKKKNMPLLSHHTALVEIKGKIYVIGGFTKPEKGPTAWVPIDNLWEYDPSADSWKALAPMPSKRGATMAAVWGGKIYVIGGASAHPGSKGGVVHPARPHRAVDTNEVYDPATNTWETRQTMPTARNHAAIGVVNNKIYVIGGRVGAGFITRGYNVDLVEEYDPATDQWGALKARLPTPRSAVAFGTYKGKIYVAGGEIYTDRMLGAYRTVEAFDPVANVWTTLPPMQFPRHGLAGDFIGNRLHLVSGNVQAASSGGHVDVDHHHALELP